MAAEIKSVTLMVTRITREKMNRVEYGMSVVDVKDWSKLTTEEMFKVRDQILKYEGRQRGLIDTIVDTKIVDEEFLEKLDVLQKREEKEMLFHSDDISTATKTVNVEQGQEETEIQEVSVDEEFLKRIDTAQQLEEKEMLEHNWNLRRPVKLTLWQKVRKFLFGSERNCLWGY